MGKLKRSRRIIRWIERYCRVPEGDHQGRPIKIRPFQRKIIEGIYDNPSGTRRAIVSFPRKNGKTSLIACFLLLHLAGPEARPNSQLFSSARSREQAATVFRLARMMVEQSPELLEYIEIGVTAKQLRCPELGTVYEALSADASTAHGKSPIFIVHDELGQVRGTDGRGPDLYAALETGTGAHSAPLSIIISTQAPNDTDLLSTLIDHAERDEDPNTFLSIWSAPDDADPFSEKTIKACNPAYGDFLNPDAVMGEARIASRLPSREASFRNLHLNQRVEGGSPYVTKSVWDRCAVGDLSDLVGREAFGGLDLSASNDLTAFVRVGWVGEEAHVKASFWLPEAGLADKARIDGVPYQGWLEQGFLTVTPGATVDYDYVAPIVLAAIREEGVQKVAFDRWNMRFFRPALVRAGATEEEIGVFVEFGQGSKSMTPALRELDTLMLNARLRHGDNPVLRMCALNATVRTDKTGGRMLTKSNPTRRIDGMVALAMAVGMAGEPTDDSVLITSVPEDYSVF